MTKLFHYFSKALLGGSLLAVSYTANAQVKLSALYKSGAVLQQGVQVPVWGTSAAGDSITVSINGKTAKAKTNSSGDWEAILPSLTAGGPYNITVSSSAKDTVKLTDVYVGDVWLAAGQSNMEFKLNADLNGTATIAAANDQTIREFYIPKGLSKELSNQLPDGTTWSAATAANAGNFSAVAYYFAKSLKQTVTAPIGIVKAAYGGARIEAFMSEEMLGFDEDFTVLQAANYYAERQPTMIYNKMIHPLLRFPVKGILWYQGESNADNLEDAKSYSNLFKTMINAYRAKLGLGDIPFIYVQLPNQGTQYGESSPQTWDAWPQIRQGQDKALKLANTGEAVTIDVGDVDIHPTNKKPVGERAALVARKVAYGEDILCNGPTYKSHSKLSAGKVQITYDFVGTGLTGKGTDTVKWFSIAGADGVLKPAKAKITGTNTVEVWNDGIASPEVIRYAWEYNPNGVNLYNSANLPAAPFYIYVNPKAYKLESFTASTKSIERGNPVFLQWTTFGASSVTLNENPVDSIAATTVYPRDTTVYVLKTVNKLDPSKMDSITITVNVQNPQPTISVSSSLGTTMAPNTKATLTADAKAPAGGTVKSVIFYVNGTALAKDSIAPYVTDWTPTTTGDYKITALVEDNIGQTKLSVPYGILVTTLKVLTYEAELATFTDKATVKNEITASNGKLLEVQDVWKLTFDNVVSPDNNTYQLTIGYAFLGTDTMKHQTMFVNGVSKDVKFSKTNPVALLQQMKVDVNLKAGLNEIRFEPSWGWMSFDFISIAIDANAVIPPSISVSSSAGATSAPKNPITLNAKVTAPNGGVTKVEFLVNNAVVSTVTTAPYQTNWTPDTAAEYTITARVYDDKANIITSKPLTILITNLTIITLEAEDAVLTGDAAVGTDAGASKGKYVDAKDNLAPKTWALKWSNVPAPKAETYELTIAYKLPYGHPKRQNLIVNGAAAIEVIFTDTVWSKVKVNIPLKEGNNEIRMEASWGWMFFDYISYAVEGTVGINDKTYENSGLVLNQNYPNPFSSLVNISFELPASGDVQLDLVNINGQTVATQNLGTLTQGSHVSSFQTGNLDNGLYVLKLTHNDKVVTRTMSLSK